MKPIEPCRKNLAPGWERVCYAEDQPEYLPLPSLRGPKPDVSVISEWEFDDGDIALMKAMIENYESGGRRPRISLTLMTFGGPLQPIRVELGESGEQRRKY